MIDIVLCASGSDEVRIVHDLANDPQRRARVVRRCADLAETLAVVAAGIGDVVLIDLSVRGLSRDPLADLLRGAAVVGLRGPDAGDRTGLGLRQVIDSSADVEQILTVIQEALDGGGDRSAAWEQEALSESRGPAGRMIVVWGPGGAPGRSTIAVNLAAEAAAAGEETILVDADTYGPALAQMLGVIDETPGLVAVCRAHDRDTLDEGTLEALLPLVQPRLRFLSGVGVPARWPELSRTALDGLWEVLTERGSTVVVDVAAPLEEDEDLSYDTAAPLRNAATVSAVQRADAVVAVTTADPVSITRLLRDHERLTDLGVGDLHVIVNRIGTPVPGDRVRDLIASRVPVAALHLLPDEPATCRAAAWDGALLAETAPRSALRRGIRDIAASSTLLQVDARAEAREPT
ncbi:AAA family ATPase [Brachybacterium muris]|uniref:AAA family ATPase n=1 Tax=Brachybacterium muris TaxID=219301 RepID=UPI00223BFA0A|nr:P-loop NTPase [Brachybacterium muris]MCT1653648.1 P-loop NTPase [Brachybacterium muris]